MQVYFFKGKFRGYKKFYKKNCPRRGISGTKTFPYKIDGKK